QKQIDLDVINSMAKGDHMFWEMPYFGDRDVELAIESARQRGAEFTILNPLHNNQPASAWAARGRYKEMEGKDLAAANARYARVHKEGAAGEGHVNILLYDNPEFKGPPEGFSHSKVQVVYHTEEVTNARTGRKVQRITDGFVSTGSKN